MTMRIFFQNTFFHLSIRIAKWPSQHSFSLSTCIEPTLFYSITCPNFERTCVGIIPKNQPWRIFLFFQIQLITAYGNNGVRPGDLPVRRNGGSKTSVSDFLLSWLNLPTIHTHQNLHLFFTENQYKRYSNE